MWLLVPLLALISPRLALFVLWLFTDLLSAAFGSWLIPLIGFFLLPWTTLAYAGMWALGVGGVRGIEWVVVILAVLADLGAFAAGTRMRSGAGSSDMSTRAA
jgi:hypothetical protein